MYCFLFCLHLIFKHALRFWWSDLMLMWVGSLLISRLTCWSANFWTHATCGVWSAIYLPVVLACFCCFLWSRRLHTCSLLLSMCQMSCCGEWGLGLFFRVVSMDHEGMVSVERWDQDDCSLQVSLLFMQCRSLCLNWYKILLFMLW